jgi:hypothetical protein
MRGESRETLEACLLTTPVRRPWLKSSDLSFVGIARGGRRHGEPQQVRADCLSSPPTDTSKQAERYWEYLDPAFRPALDCLVHQ